MRNTHAAVSDFAPDSGIFKLFMRRQAARAGGLAMLAAAAFGFASMATWNVADPSFSHATSNEVTNAGGYAGAVFADIAIQFFGLSAIFVLLPLISWGVVFLSGRKLTRTGRHLAAWVASIALFAAAAGCIPAPATWPLPTGLGGVAGDVVLKIPAAITGNYPHGFLAFILVITFGVPAVVLSWYACAFSIFMRPVPAAPESELRYQAVDEDEEDDEEEVEDYPLFGALVHWWLSSKALFRRIMARRQNARAARTMQAEPPLAREPVMGGPGRLEPDFDIGALSGSPQHDDDEEDYDDPDNAYEEFADTDYAEIPAAHPQGANVRIAEPAPRPKPGRRVSREAQASLLASGDFEMPPLHYLSEPKSVARDKMVSKESLEQNARLLEGVLEDFGVRGEIIEVRPGPVVTLYELEPAPGIKSSRVIGLADDIARSMSAIAARVAVVPGRNAIGIELPNQSREMVYLRELLASSDFENSKAKLALGLGKTINGEPVIADLAKMPHLLVAGTTGSGKSVAINTMILSILYRMTPEQCRLIMIDPKMLELSVYDGIPHLLTPVVTDPKKAVVALKWTVREMEDRYRKMSKVGVRNIEGFNQRVEQAQKKGTAIKRTVQTGFDRQTGEAIYETEELDMEPMPFIVVIIDEMADLMMVAGKDIEGAVQRLAQMARAAGIHVIMATQRPSVDVITGTIKANFPTRISFQVTSKIDSRTILGEQGAEQLLGMGDMLYMAGGGRIRRVHGPFVSDDEVEKIVSHLKLQGVPEYLDAITEDDEDGDSGSSGGSGGGNFSDSDDPYDQAVAIVLRDGKASTSYVQRRLGIGYNRAASIIERMEEEGIIGPANHAGKREILVPTEEDKL